MRAMQLVEGQAEIFGTELALGEQLSLRGQKLAVRTLASFLNKRLGVQGHSLREARSDRSWAGIASSTLCDLSVQMQCLYSVSDTTAPSLVCTGTRTCVKWHAENSRHCRSSPGCRCTHGMAAHWSSHQTALQLRKSSSLCEHHILYMRTEHRSFLHAWQVSSWLAWQCLCLGCRHAPYTVLSMQPDTANSKMSRSGLACMAA